MILSEEDGTPEPRYAAAMRAFAPGDYPHTFASNPASETGERYHGDDFLGVADAIVTWKGLNHFLAVRYLQRLDKGSSPPKVDISAGFGTLCLFPPIPPSLLPPSMRRPDLGVKYEAIDESYLPAGVLGYNKDAWPVVLPRAAGSRFQPTDEIQQVEMVKQLLKAKRRPGHSNAHPMHHNYGSQADPDLYIHIPPPNTHRTDQMRADMQRSTSLSNRESNTGHAGRYSRTYIPDPIDIPSAYRVRPVVYAGTDMVSPEFRPGRSSHPGHNNGRDFSYEEEVSPHSHWDEIPPSTFNVNQGQRYDRGGGAREIDQSGESSNDCKCQLIW